MRIMSTAIALFVLSSSILPMAVRAEDPQCLRNFQPAADGSSFRTFVEFKTSQSRSDLIEDLAQDFAVRGLQGVNANKEIGVVSAMQLSGTPPQPFPINVIVKKRDSLTHIEIVVNVATNAKPSAVSIRNSLCQLLAPILPAQERLNSAGTNAGFTSSPVSVFDSNKWIPLALITGGTRQEGYPPFSFMLYEDFTRAHSSTSVNEKRLRLHVVVDQEPTKEFAIVKLESNERENTRTLKIGSAREFLRSRTLHGMHPDPDWTLPFEVVKTAENEWDLLTRAEVSPGEYGLFDFEKQVLFDFAVR